MTGDGGPPSEADHTDNDSLLLMMLNSVRRAIRDEEVDRGALKVLANVSEHVNHKTRTAWPARERIADEEGMDPKTVHNKLYILKRRKYLDWERRPNPSRPNRTLLHYRILEQEITTVIMAKRAKSALSGGQEKCPAGWANAESALPGGLETALPAGSESALRAGNKEHLKGTSQERETRAQSADATHAPKERETPHMNGRGFVISTKHDLVIPTEVVDRWRQQFPDLPILEAHMAKLSSVILTKGPMHPGWTCPEGWMAGCLADDNRKAANEAVIAQSRQGKSPARTFKQ